jgi:hypothetical protein
MGENEKNNIVKNSDIVEEDVLKVYKNKDIKGNKEILKKRFYHGSKKTKHEIPKKRGK